MNWLVQFLHIAHSRWHETKWVIGSSKRTLRMGQVYVCSTVILLEMTACASSVAPMARSAFVPTKSDGALSATAAKPTKTISEVLQTADGSNLLDSVHLSKGLVCRDCHTLWPPSRIVSNSDCIACHTASFPTTTGASKRRASTPHRAHVGDLNCNQCHHAHEPSELFCNKCHTDMNYPDFK